MTAKTEKMIEVERKIREPIEQFLKREYEENKRGHCELAEELSVSHATAFRWINVFSVKTRNAQESKLREGAVVLSEEDLRKMYVENGATMSYIAKQAGVTITTVKNWLNQHNISSRDQRESRWKDKAKCPSKEELENMYLNQSLSTPIIAKNLGMNDCTIGEWLRKYNIPIRDKTQRRTRSGVSKLSKEELTRLYLDEQIPSTKIGKRSGVESSTILGWCREYSIPIRSNKESHKPKTIPPKEELEKLYVEGRNTKEIGRIFRVSNRTVIRWMESYEIDRRNKAGIYDNRSYRQQVLDKVIEQTSKTPDQLVAADFARVIGDDGTSHNGIIAWYRRKHSCGYTEGLNFLLSDLLNISQDTDDGVESLLEQYVGGAKHE